MTPPDFKFSEAYPSPYLRAPDLMGEERTLTITGWRYTGKDDKGEDGRQMRGTVLTFEETEKVLVANVTNFRAIQLLHGIDPNDWTGRRVTFFPTTTRLGNDPHKPCIRVKIPE
jgi:hypothetical protein